MNWITGISIGVVICVVTGYKLFFYACAFILGLWVPFIIYLRIVTTARPSDIRPPPVFKQFAFASSEQTWKSELLHLSKDKRVVNPVFPQSFILSDAVDNMLESINREFVLSWYTKFSPDKVFPSILDQDMRLAIGELGSRANNIDWSDFIVRTAMPLVTKHINRFVTATAIVREKSSFRTVTDSSELHSAVADAYGPLHPAVGNKNYQYETARKTWLRQRVHNILPFFMKNTRSELESTIVSKLCTDIISASVLFPLLTMFSDADFWNQTIVKYARDALSDQSKVYRFRKALEAHIKSAAGAATSTMSTSSRSRLSSIQLSSHADEYEYERFLRKIRACKSLAEARQVRYYISVQLKRTAKENPGSLYERRLKAGKQLIDQQIAQLSGGEESEPSSPGGPGGASAVATTTNTLSSASTNNLPAVTPLASHTETPSIHIRKTSDSSSGHPDPRNAYSLNEVLADPSCSVLFMEFMDQRRRTMLLQFWLAVNSLDRNEDPLGGIEIGNNENEKEITSDFPDSDDIAELYRKYFTSSSPDRLPGVDDKVGQTIECFVSAEHPTRDQYIEARRAIFDTQSRVFGMIKDRDFARFKRSDMFLKFLASAGIKRSSAGNIDQLQLVGEGGHEAEVVQAVQEAFHDIIGIEDEASNAGTNNSKEKSSKRELIGRVLDTPEKLLGKLASKTERMRNRRSIDIKDRSRSPFRPPSVVDLTSGPTLEVDRTSVDIGNDGVHGIRVYENADKGRAALSSKSESNLSVPGPNGEKDRARSVSPGKDPNAGRARGRSPNKAMKGNADWLHDELLTPSENQATDFEPEIHMAAPGDLGLTEAISVLSEDIEKLYHQKEVVEYMLRKAELTNNTLELRILGKSLTSLNREIQQKELQRQQYIVQESDNSLYGKSDIQIQSYMYATDKYGEYILYLVEVTRYAEDGNVSAGWIVARRYNQFFELHQHLREKFSQVKLLEFPRKKVLLKFQNKAQLEQRRVALETYMRALLKMPQVCQYKEFRYFLSSETLDRPPLQIRPGGSADYPPELRSPSPGIQTSPSLTGMTTTSTSTSMSSTSSEYEEPIRRAFVQPICDLFIQIFGLDSGDYSLRGRAVVVILQQLLGGTVEKKVRDFVRSQTAVRVLTDRINSIRNVMWPNGNGKLRTSTVRTSAEKTQCRYEAGVMLAQLISNMCSRVLGSSSSKYASRTIFSMYQNEILNAHLIYSLFDELLDVLYPEAKT